MYMDVDEAMGVTKKEKTGKYRSITKTGKEIGKENRKEDSGPRVKHAMRYYNLQDNPCRKAGAIGKSKGEPKDFWMQEEFNAFLETVNDKPETRMAFLLLYWTGMRIGELLALTYNDINLEEKTISINKSYQRLKGKDMITQPKTPKSIRVITMPDFLAEEFREYCSHLYGIMKKERLFRFTKSHMEHCMAILVVYNMLLTRFKEM